MNSPADYSTCSAGEMMRRRFRSAFYNAVGDFTDEKHVFDTRAAEANVIRALSSHKTTAKHRHAHTVYMWSGTSPATNFTSFLFSPVNCQEKPTKSILPDERGNHDETFESVNECVGSSPDAI